jgi:hypothetical protein
MAEYLKMCRVPHHREKCRKHSLPYVQFLLLLLELARQAKPSFEAVLYYLFQAFDLRALVFTSLVGRCLFSKFSSSFLAKV